VHHESGHDLLGSGQLTHENVLVEPQPREEVAGVDPLFVRHLRFVR
jgi:hypothetical protein